MNLYRNVPDAAHASEKKTQQHTASKDYTTYISERQSAFAGSPGETYLKARGIAPEIAAAAGVGYDPAFRSPDVPSYVPTSPRIIFPCGNSAFMTRDIRADNAIPKGGIPKQRVGSRDVLFGCEELRAGHDVVVIVEGEVDALSVRAAGHPAVALGGVSSTEKLLAAISAAVADGYAVPRFIVALDNDSAGEKAADGLCTALHARGWSAAIRNVSGEHNDPNDALVHNMQAFCERVAEIVDGVRQTSVEDLREEEELRTHAVQHVEAQAHCDEMQAGASIEAFWAHTDTTGNVIPTGLRGLDSVLGGGLYPGVIVIGGRTGIGKSTFVMQMVEDMARMGQPVLYVSVEMDRWEIWARGIVRQLYRDDPSQSGGISYGRLLVRRGDPNGVPERMMPAVTAAMQRYYMTVGPNMYFLDDLCQSPTMTGVAAAARDIRMVRRTAPVVVLDYIQRIAPESDTMTALQAANANMAAMKALANELGVPVIAVSAFNRASYRLDAERSSGGGARSSRANSIDESAFHTACADMLESGGKDSGEIEYKADVFLGLRLAERGDETSRVDVYVVKNRRGSRPIEPVRFAFTGSRGTFEPVASTSIRIGTPDVVPLSDADMALLAIQWGDSK